MNIYSFFNSFKYLFIFLFCSVFLSAQQVNPYLVRSQIYNNLVDAIAKEFKTAQAVIGIDPTINKFDKVDFTDFEIILDQPRYEADSVFCNANPQLNCVSKIEIDRYRIHYIYQVDKDEDYPHYFGIYAPLDTWYQLVYQAFIDQVKPQAKKPFTVTFPVRHVYSENGEQKEHILFYQVRLDEQFQIIKILKIP